MRARSGYVLPGLHMSVERTGIYYQAPKERPDILDAPAGEHVWTVLVCHRLSDREARAAARGQQVNLDAENLALTRLACYRCEAPYSERLSYRRCPGDPQ